MLSTFIFITLYNKPMFMGGGRGVRFPLPNPPGMFQAFTPPPSVTLCLYLYLCISRSIFLSLSISLSFVLFLSFFHSLSLSLSLSGAGYPSNRISGPSLLYTYMMNNLSVYLPIIHKYIQLSKSKYIYIRGRVVLQSKPIPKSSEYRISRWISGSKNSQISGLPDIRQNPTSSISQIGISGRISGSKKSGYPVGLISCKIRYPALDIRPIPTIYNIHI